jgi:hypothetical protein
MYKKLGLGFDKVMLCCAEASNNKLEKTGMTTTMTSTKTQITNTIKNTIAFSTICIATAASSTIFVPSVFAQYGLGLPKSASSGGATRSTDSLPQVTILVPGDGARTLASRPTFYWYIAPQDVEAATSNPSTTVPQVDSSFKVTFFLRDSNEKASKSIFKAEGKAQGAGLYKFTLPENAPELKKRKVQRWQVRWEGKASNGTAMQVDVNALVRRDNDPLISKEITSAKNDLARARIYAKNAYWYDAIDTYTSWISKNPKDNLAIAERSKLLKVGLPNNPAFINVQKGENGLEMEEFIQARFANFLSAIDKSKNVLSIALEPKKN